MKDILNLHAAARSVTAAGCARMKGILDLYAAARSMTAATGCIRMKASSTCTATDAAAKVLAHGKCLHTKCGLLTECDSLTKYDPLTDLSPVANDEDPRGRAPRLPA